LPFDAKLFVSYKDKPFEERTRYLYVNPKYTRKNWKGEFSRVFEILGSEEGGEDPGFLKLDSDLFKTSSISDLFKRNKKSRSTNHHFLKLQDGNVSSDISA